METKKAMCIIKAWAADELVTCRDWPISSVQFMGWNFYMIIFKESGHRNLALEAVPWFIERKFMYIFSWDMAFDIIGSYTMLLVWI